MKPDTRSALEPFLRRIRSPALAFASLRLRDEDAALDMVQETMIGFVKVAQDFETAAWKNLFYKILLRRITDWQRKVAWRKRLYHILPFSQLGDADDDETDGAFTHTGNATLDTAASAYDAEILAGQFERALQSLPARQQEAYLLRQWQAMSVKETADIMGCSEGSVKTHLSRAMQTLRGQLGEWLDE